MNPQLLAQIRNPVVDNSLGTPGETGGGTAIGSLIGGIVGSIMIIATLLAMLFLIKGGISWITAGGDKTQLENARNTIIHAIIGLIIIASVWAIMNIVGPFLGLTFPDFTLPAIQ